MRSMLLSAKWVNMMRDVIDKLPAPVYAVSPELAEQVTGYHVHRGALASMQRKPLPTAEELLRSARRVVVMEAVNDHTNIGAIFRSAAALGMDAVLLSPDCADPLYRRSVKVSMGAVCWFRTPVSRPGPRAWRRSVTPASTCSPSPRTRRRGPWTRRPRTGWTGRADAGRGGRRPVHEGPDGGGRMGPHPDGPRRRLAQRQGAAAAVAFYAVATGRPQL